MIAFRKAHPVVKAPGKPAACGFPDFSIHNERPWNDYCDQETRVIGLMFAGRTEDDTRDDVVYIGLNAHWEAHTVVLPELSKGHHWKIMMNTSLPHTSESAYQKGTPVSGNNEVCIGARSLMVAVME